MGKIADHLSPEDFERIGGLSLLAERVVEGFCSGLHRSPHKGFSVEFKQHRQYVPGDELRRLDWKVYGKTDRFFIREYEEETNAQPAIREWFQWEELQAPDLDRACSGRREARENVVVDDR